MPAYTKPVGLQPVQLIGGIPYAGATREYTITSGYATALRPGDLVAVASGVIAKVTATTTVPTGGVIGVFIGCSFTDPVLGKTFRTNWTASTVAADAVAVVAEDPKLVMRAVYVSGTTVVAGQTAAAVIGKNVALVQNTTSTGTSDVAVTGAATTNTLPMRVLDVDRESADASGNFTAVFVTYNGIMHAYNNATGT
jgi:hypothetical protein